MPGAKSQVRPESPAELPPRWRAYLAKNPDDDDRPESASPAATKPVITLFG
jgi:hypothetical protein